MNNTNITTVEKLCSAFPMLTEVNQQYVLGLAEGLKKAQNSVRKERPKISEKGHRKTND
jgi:hypothetical protein